MKYLLKALTFLTLFGVELLADGAMPKEAPKKPNHIFTGNYSDQVDGAGGERRVDFLSINSFELPGSSKLINMLSYQNRDFSSESEDFSRLYHFNSSLVFKRDDYQIVASVAYAGDEMFKSDDALSLNLFALGNFYERDEHSLQLGIVATDKHLYMDGINVIPFVSYTFTSGGLKLSAPLPLMCNWEISRKFRLNLTSFMLLNNRVEFSYSPIMPLTLSLLYNGARQTYYLTEDKSEGESIVLVSNEAALQVMGHVHKHASLLLSGGYRFANSYYDGDELFSFYSETTNLQNEIFIRGGAMLRF